MTERVLVIGAAENARRVSDEHGNWVLTVLPHAAWNLGVLLDFAEGEFGTGGGVLVVTRWAAESLGLHVKAPLGVANAPELDPVRARGWDVAALAPWMAVHSENAARPRVWIAVLPWLSARTGPMWREGIDPWEFARHLAEYHAVLGVPFAMTPGVTGVGLLRDRTRLSETPFWKAPVADLPHATRHAEDDYRTWVGPGGFGDEGAFEHTYDVNAMYLAAAGSVYLPVGRLEFSRGGEFDSRRGGYWQIERPVWNVPELPHPVGNHRPDGDGLIWVTSPTMALLEDLALLGVVAAPRVLASWTAGTLRIMRTWQERLRDALAHEVEYPAVRRAVKATYAETIGLLGSENGRQHGRVFRPDWRHTLIGQARCNLFRKIHAAGQLSGRFPVRIEVDAVTYRSDEFDAVAAAPDGFPVSERLGGFKSVGEPVRMPRAPYSATGSQLTE